MNVDSFLLGVLFGYSPLALEMAEDIVALEKAAHALSLFTGMPPAACKYGLITWVNMMPFGWRDGFALILAGQKDWLQFCPQADENSSAIADAQPSVSDSA